MKILQQKLFVQYYMKIKRLSTDTWKIQFRWSESRYNDSLIKYLLKISKEWYDPFTRYLQHIDRQKRNEWLSDKDTNIKEDELKQLLLDNLADYLPGFKYLFEYSWDSYDDNNNLHKGDFIIASDSDAVNSKALKCKKYITLIGATFTNFTIELIDNDEIIMQNLKEFHNSQEESPSILNTGTITITAAAAVVVGYLICRTFSRRDD
ncbi:14815_t:CDS:2 [Rhizophagus irregularis]|nr:14815_t:CDS:2 [Rhizophagus irregularis]